MDTGPSDGGIISGEILPSQVTLVLQRKLN